MTDYVEYGIGWYVFVSYGLGSVSTARDATMQISSNILCGTTYDVWYACAHHLQLHPQTL